LDGRAAIGPDGGRFASAFKSGFYTVGETTMTAWLAGDPSLPPGTSESVRKVVAAMSSVEGGLEAVNSYDDAHLSFGVFQWTAGVGDGAGELAALLARFKNNDPEAYRECFGQYRLDVQVEGEQSTTGLITLNGTALKTSAEKEPLRGIDWAYRFWRAGHHKSLRACQFALAASRIHRFASLDVHGRPLKDWMSSELGMALILDEHVNRPGHVPNTLREAIDSIQVQTSDPKTWSDGDENRLIDVYLSERDATNMTDSRKRAATIEGYVHRGSLSDKRGSFSM
jgi:hypothetical protein